MRLGSRLALAALLILAGAFCAAAEEGRQWTFREIPGDGDTRKDVARLVYAVAGGNDGIQVSAECDGTVSGAKAVSRLLFITDIGALAAGKETELRFTGGGFERLAKGRIARLPGDGGAGVALTITVADALWELLAVTGALDYMVPGYRASALPLAEGRARFSEFLDACKRLAASATPAAASEDTSEADAKAAFANAKQLGTADAWRAFLANYPNGFHADLARAYLKKLDADPAADRGSRR